MKRISSIFAAIAIIAAIILLPASAYARGSGGGGYHSFSGGSRGYSGGSKSGSYSSHSTQTFKTAGGKNINASSPRFTYGTYGLRSTNGSFYRVVNGKYSSSPITGRVTNSIPTANLRVATVGGRTYKWDSRAGFNNRVYAPNKLAYLGPSSAPGPRLTTPFVPSTVYHQHFYPGYGWGGGYYYGMWYGPSLSDIMFWNLMTNGSVFGNGGYNNGYQAGLNAAVPPAGSVGAWGNVPQPVPSPVIVTQPANTVPCDYFDANGHPVHVTVVADACPVTDDTSTPPPDSIDTSQTPDDDNQ